MKTRFFLPGLLLPLLAAVMVARAQVVGVTAQLDTNVVAVGQSTTLHIYAQVLPAYRANAERIFSWYVDVLNTNGAAAVANYAAMLKPTSDKDPQTSSNGFNSAANRLTIYDTFLNLPGAGTNPPVELMRIPVTGLAVGQTRFGVRHGTGQPSLSQDFIVAPKDGGEFMSGGEYSGAFINLTVLAAPASAITCLTITHTNLSATLHKVTLSFCPVSGYNHYVEYRDQVSGGTGWQTALGGPYNSGVYVETNSVPTRFYRVRAILPGALSPFRVDIARVAPGQVRLTYPTTNGFNYTIESRTNLVAGTWQTLPGGPYNSGNVIITNPAPMLYFRVGATPQ